MIFFVLLKNKIVKTVQTQDFHDENVKTQNVYDKGEEVLRYNLTIYNEILF